MSNISEASQPIVFYDGGCPLCRREIAQDFNSDVRRRAGGALLKKMLRKCENFLLLKRRRRYCLFSARSWRCMHF